MNPEFMVKKLNRATQRLPLTGLLTLFILANSLWGCGAVNTASSIKDAEIYLREATALDAKKNAPYEYTKASTYLRKAKELEGHGLYEYAAAFARRGQLWAEKAQAVARLAIDRERRAKKFSKKKVPSFTPSGE